VTERTHFPGHETSQGRAPSTLWINR